MERLHNNGTRQTSECFENGSVRVPKQNNDWLNDERFFHFQVLSEQTRNDIFELFFWGKVTFLRHKIIDLS